MKSLHTWKKLLFTSDTSRAVSATSVVKAPQLSRRANKNVLRIMSILNIAQCPRRNSHGDLALVAARMNLIFTSHSIDFQLIFTYFSLFVAEAFLLFFFCTARSLLVPLMFAPIFCFYLCNSFFMSRDAFFTWRRRRGSEKYKYLFRLPFLPPSELMRLLPSASCVLERRLPSYLLTECITVWSLRGRKNSAQSNEKSHSIKANC